MKAYAIQDIPPDFDLVFVEKALHERGFAEHFERHIKPKLLEIEPARLDARAVSRKRSGIATLLGAVFVPPLIVTLAIDAAGNSAEWIVPVLGITTAPGVLLYYWARGPVRQSAIDRKHVIIPEVLKFIGDFHYEPGGKIDEETLRASRLFKPWKRYDGEQLVSGSHLSRPFQAADSALTTEDSRQFLEELHEVLDIIEIMAEATDLHWQPLPAEN